MKKVKQFFVVFLATALAGGVAMLVATAASSGAGATPMCPSIGNGSGCAYIITVNPSGTVSITPGADSASFDGRGEGDDVMVGVVNDSNAIVSSVALSGTSNAFGFDGDGICTETFTSPISSNYCQTNGPGGGASYTTSRGRTTGINPYDYQGPDNTFTNITTSHRTAGTGTIAFTTPLLPQGTTFLSLEAAPTRTTATATLQTGLKVSVPAIANAVEGTAWSGQVATFTDTGSISPASYFQATINWGDGTSSNTSNSSSPTTPSATIGGSGGSFTVSGTHTYAEETPSGAPDQPTVTITDPDLVSYSSAVATVTSGKGSVVVTDAPLAPGTAAPIGPQQTNVPFTTSATFTDGNTAAPTSDFANTTITWGDGTTSTTGSTTDPVVVTGSGGSFTVTGTHVYTANTANDPGGSEPSPVTFNIVDIAGSTTTVTANKVDVADSVTSCAGGAACSGTLNAGSGQPVGATVGTSTGETGDLLVSANPTVNSSGAPEFSCGDTFAHAPSVISESNTFSAPTGTITSSDSFPAADGVILDSSPGVALSTPEAWGPGLGQSSSFWVCFRANQEFNDVSGGPAPSSTDGAGNTLYTGLLPLCDPAAVGAGPCVNYVSVAPNASNVLTVSEQITYPASFASSGDPYRY
ncbi:MAG TPA: hypothetical protein VK773_04495 [Acidimicrobiales bacterium]|jgi:hypothetical protein|nr:hypothetical protein [Acidimicrobiales bacterium]